MAGLRRRAGVDKDDNLYVTGVFSAIGGATPTFGTATFDTTVLTSTSRMGMFLAKYDTAGTLKWVRGSTGGAFMSPYAIRTDDRDGVYCAGNMNGYHVYFGAVALDALPNTAGGAFIVKYDTAGNAHWANTAGGSRGAVLRSYGHRSFRECVHIRLYA